MSGLMDRCLQMRATLHCETMSKPEQVWRSTEYFEEMLMSDVPGTVGQKLSEVIQHLEGLRQQHGITREQSIAHLSPDELASRWEILKSTAELGIQAACKILILGLDLAQGRLPVEAMLEIRKYRDLVIPELIDRLERAIRDIEGGIDINGSPLIILFLLAEFKATAAFPVILKALSLPEEQPFELFGDAITENMSSILAQTVGQSFEQLDVFILQTDANEYARRQAVNVYLQHVRSRQISREAALERLREFLRTALQRRDTILATAAVSGLKQLAPREAMREIDSAYNAGLIDVARVRYQDVQSATYWGQAEIAEALDNGLPTKITDCIAGLKGWACFQKHSRPADAQKSLFIPAPHSPPSSSGQAKVFANSARSSNARPGRNDQCPCGSGKKYKKCCGLADTR